MNKTLIARALSLAFMTGVASTVFVGAAYAQSNTTGSIFGDVDAPAGATVTITNSSGYHRTITPDASGRFVVPSVPAGQYSVTLSRGGKTEKSVDSVAVKIGQGAEVNFGAATQTIEITGRKIAIDVSSSSGGTNFSARQLEVLPIQPTIASIVQLAPSTTRSDFRYGNNAASFGGAGSSENAVFVNGFTVTNGLYQVGYPSLPFGAIDQAQVITGGYGAEFGRSTGGVINLTTKSGSNSFELSTGFSSSPNALRSRQKDIVYPTTGAARNAATDGKLYYYNGDNKRDEGTWNISLGGPIIKDKLFFYYAAETKYFKQQSTRLSSASTTAATVGWLDQTGETPRSLTKLDWNITDDHHLEYTGIRDKTMTHDKYMGFNYATLTHNDIQKGGASFTNFASGVPFLSATGAQMSATQGADIDIVKYTGYITPDLTVQGLIGKSYTPRQQLPFGYIPGLYPSGAAIANRAPGITYTPSLTQGFTGNLLADNAHDENKGFRFDLEYKLGTHTLRAGVDNNHIKAVNGNSTAGGGTWTYLKANDPTALLSGMTAAPNSTGSPLGALGYYVDETHISSASTPQVKQSAMYIEDKIQLTKNFLLTVGLRDEKFQNLNERGQVFVEQKRQIAPRVAASWDVNGDSSMKLFGTGGRYHLGIPANLAVRFAGPSLNTEHFYTYTGVDPVTAAPTGLKSIGPVFSANNEYGAGRDADGIAAVSLKAHYQDEFTLGIERALTPNWNGGIRLVYRKLKSTIDDVSDPRAVAAKLQQAGATQAQVQYFMDNWQGSLFNPGMSNTFLVPIDDAGNKRLVTVGWNEWGKVPTGIAGLPAPGMPGGFPEGLKRDYIALDFMLEHPMRDHWYGKLDYTWSRSTGNTEGQQHSDNGQADIGFTSTWDFPEIMLNNSGVLPNDRTHQIKAYGLYEITPEWGIGANVLMASGRPRQCTANWAPYMVDTTYTQYLGQYSPTFFVCPGAAGRAAMGRLPWDNRLDLSFMYKPQYIKGLLVKLDVFNVFNRQTPTAIDEALNVRSAADAISPTSQQVINYTAPRAATFSVQYYKKF